METITNPHDRFFKETWSRKDVAEDFLREYLPPPVAGLLDFCTLEISKDSFVEPDLREFYSDLLYKAKVGGLPGYLYMLFEHKSYYERQTPLKLLSYMQRIWELHLKQGGMFPLPVVLPLVLYHGQVSWPDKAELAELFDTKPILREYIPNYHFSLVDLSRYPDEAIKGAVIYRVAMLLMKHVHHPEFSKKLPGILRLLRELVEKRTGLEYLETVLRYVVQTAEDVAVEELKQMVEEAISREEGVMIVTLAERLHNEGLQQGMQQGIQQGMLEEAREGILDNLEARFDVVPESIARDVRGIEELGVLKALRRKSVKVATLDEFKGLLERAKK